MGTPHRGPAGDAGGRFEGGVGPDGDGARRAPPRSPEPALQTAPPAPDAGDPADALDRRADASSSRQRHRLLLVACLLSGAATHAYHLTLYPLYTTDEGIYIQQAWSVLRQARLSP